MGNIFDSRVSPGSNHPSNRTVIGYVHRPPPPMVPKSEVVSDGGHDEETQVSPKEEDKKN